MALYRPIIMYVNTIINNLFYKGLSNAAAQLTELIIGAPPQSHERLFAVIINIKYNKIIYNEIEINTVHKTVLQCCWNPSYF